MSKINKLPNVSKKFSRTRIFDSVQLSSLDVT